MQHLGAEVGKFGGFLETDDLDAARLGTNTRVGGLHSVHVGPDLDAIGAQPSADQGCRKIRTAATDRSWNAFPRRTDEAAHDRHATLLQEWLNATLQAIVDLLDLRHSAAVLRVGDDHLTRID